MKPFRSATAIALTSLLLVSTPQLFAQHTGHGSAAAPSTRTEAPPRTEVSAAALQSLAVAMSDASAALAKDDFALYQSLRTSVRNALHDLEDADPKLAATLTTTPADPLPNRGNLTDARKDFVRFSTAVTDVVRSRKIQQSANLRIFECTMAPEIGTGRWLQQEAGAKNPFFGSAMLKCGVELDRKVSARALPPGHPPVEGLTPADYARYAGIKPAAAPSGGCGGCGMSKEAMAAGEPCEHSKK
ncbi:DUF3347 domain-containing protein [Oleiharenicola lentus]|uniref:DUF3347 domain-containing protein n=1 Tax=Oleiharenicola lentus TaxID=2508720 RepID=A0A4Q1C6B7_9BACT|nr:DUF3347 domain-containing protein [Oleiharenicola lentus]RXK54403.1 DUF3347 domain-containing protein [Oleiharenicola lentus]